MKNLLSKIHPMVYISESSIKGISKKYNFPIITNPCPADKREKEKILRI